MQTHAQTPPEARLRWAALAVVSFATAMIILDSTVVAVALPTIIDKLGLTITSAEWVTTIYTVAFAALLIPAGQMVDRVGARRLLLTGVTLFVIASALAGVAQNAGELLFARLFQGVSGSMILPSSLATLTALFTDKSRAAAFGVWGAVIGGMAAFGPLVGGWLTTNASWRWVFFVNMPIGMILAVAALFVMPKFERRSVDRFDLRGALLVMLTLAAVTFGLVQGQRYGWLVSIRESSLGPLTWGTGVPSQSLVAFVVAFLGVAGVWRRERNAIASGRPSYVNWRLFEQRGFRWGNVAGAGINFGEVGLVFVLPLFLQAVLGLSAWDTGLILAALAAGAFLGGPFAGEIARRKGEKPVVIGGTIILLLALAGAAVVVSPTVTGGQLAPWLALAGIGIGAVQAQLSSVILEDVADEDAGQASGVQSTFRQLGATFGVALVGTVLTMALTSGATADFAAQPSIPTAQASRYTEALAASGGTALAGLRNDPNLAPVVDALDETFATAVKGSILVTLAGFVIALGAASRLPGSREPAETPVLVGS